MLSISHSTMPPELGGGADDDVEAAVVALERRQFAHVVGIEIRLREDAAAGAAGSHQRGGGFALVEAVGAARARCCAACARGPLHERGAGLRAAGRRSRKMAAEAGSLRKSSVAFAQHVDVALFEHEAALGET